MTRLRAHVSFIRDDETVGEVSWEERLARAYESKLFKEYAMVSDFRLLCSILGNDVNHRSTSSTSNPAGSP